jgi:hypothetical protein
VKILNPIDVMPSEVVLLSGGDLEAGGSSRWLAFGSC